PPSSPELLPPCPAVHATLPKRSRRLGHGWCANGCTMSGAIYRGRTVTPTRGPIITAAIDYLDGSDGGQRYLVEDGGFPEASLNALRQMFGRKAFTRHAFSLAEMVLNIVPSLARSGPIMPWLGQGAAAATGVSTLRPS